MIRWYSVSLVLVLGALYVAIASASLTGGLGLLLLASVAALVVDALLQRTDDRIVLGGLNRVGAGIAWRFFYWEILSVVFLLRSGELSRSQQVVVVVAVAAHHPVLALHSGLQMLVNAGRLRRVETWNLPVPGDALPPAPPDWLQRGGGRLVLNTAVLLLAALGWAFVNGSYALVAPAAVVMVVAALVPPLLLVPYVAALRRLPTDDVRLAAAQRAVADLAPVVILYFSGGRNSVYQVNMWLETMQRLDRPVLVLLRERRYLPEFGPTTVPVLCLPYSIDLMNLGLPGARVGLYVSNVGKNIHLLREPALKSAFIGHGDSDKTASFNPFAKVYDEVWVAGEGGRQRYLRAQVGVREDEIVLVGRPQLDGIQSAQPRPANALFTVLYAPTWEGWTEDPHQSSVVSMGPQIVRLLLATPGVRILYKQHPLTGSVNPAAAAVNQLILELLEAAGPPHVAVVGVTTLFECFNESDALISDISSVVSDYLKSEKPYFVTNGAAMAEDAFREQNPSASAAYLIGPDAHGLQAGLAEARGPDRMRAERTRARAFLLGDPDSDAMTQFRQAVDNLVARADAQASVTRIGTDDDERMELETTADSRAEILTGTGEFTDA